MHAAMGKPQGEACMPLGGGRFDAAAVGFCNGTSDGQPQAAPIRIGMGSRGVSAIETIKQTGQDFGVNVLPRVLHRH